MTAPRRNDSCPCGSGKKYKQCCLAKDEAKAREAREKAAAAAPVAVEAADAHHAERPKKRQDSYQPWKSGSQNTRGFNKISAPRKVGSG